MYKMILTSDWVKIEEFFKNRYFELGTAFGTKYVPSYASIFMDEIESNFLDTQDFKPLIGFDMSMMFSLFEQKEKLEEFLKDFNNYHPNIKFSHEFIKKAFPLWTLKWTCLEVNW